MSSDPESPRFQALRYISHSRFHRLFKYGDLTITYADIGVPSDTTILFMPGMFASRYLAVMMHAIADTLGVRVLVVDRPGMGASSPVSLESRVSAWTDLVPRLLSHLDIPHVALASHSAGMIYLLNTLHHCRGLLHPEKPYVAFLAPWVNPTHTRITSMQLAQFLPTFTFSIWNQIPRFLLLTASPALESSGAAMSKISAVSGSSLRVGLEDAQSAAEERNRKRVESVHGVSRPVQRELEDLVFRFMFEESTEGANEEARQCLCKGPKGSWGVCGDYGGFVRGLGEGERARMGRGGGGGRLMVRGYFAESDSMIGEKGREYVERCWKGQDGADSGGDGGGFDDVLDFEAVVVPGTDHNSIMQETGLFEKIFLEAGGRQNEVVKKKGTRSPGQRERARNPIS